MTGEGGSSTIVMTGIVGLLALVTAATTGLGLAYSARAQAQTAADAAALAAAVATYPATSIGNPLTQAREAAAANGALLVSCACPMDASLGARVVTVATGVIVDVPLFGRLDVRARSRAEFDPRLWLGR